MNRYLVKFSICLSFLLFSITVKSQNEEWSTSGKNHLIKSNVEYIFPKDVDLNVRLEFINKCENAIKENLAIIQGELKDTICIEFMKDKKEMKRYTGLGVNGVAILNRKATLMILREKAPIKHELLHLLSMINWGQSHNSSCWMNEGLAMNGSDYNGISMEEIYWYMVQNNKTIPMNKLTENFYNNHEVVSYYQCGYIVQDLIEKQGLNNFKKVWNKGFDSFEEIYGFSFTSYLELTHKRLSEKYSKKQINLDWEKFYNM